MVAEVRRRQGERRGRDRTRGGGGRVARGDEAVAEQLPTVYTYIMQMVPIISEVYNRSINLLTGRKGSGELRVTTRGVAAMGAGARCSDFHQHHRRALANGGVHTTVDKCILLAYHLYAWSFVLSLALDFPLSLSFVGTHLDASRTGV